MTTSPSSDERSKLRRNGRSFWLASLFLPREVAADATVLYSFCRSVDDLADHAKSGGELERLCQIRQGLETRTVTDSLLVPFSDLAKRRHIDTSAATYLLDAMLSDARGNVAIESEDELVRYCYGAAGTVGLMMAPILGVADPEAMRSAADLGIAMQLTNIARDVLEDARLGRRYLPADWVRGLAPREIAAAAEPATHAAKDLGAIVVLSRATRRTLDLAEAFYASGALGFSSIPAAARRGIQIAASVYREIGLEVRRRGCDVRSGRCVVNFQRKSVLLALVFAGRCPVTQLARKYPRYGNHPALSGLPGFV